MTQPGRPYVIMNPASGGGRTGRLQPLYLNALEEHFPNGFTLEVTSENGEAGFLTTQALKSGSELIVVVGGDGTCNEVVNGFFSGRKPVRPSARLGFVCSGTGQDVLRNLRLPRGLMPQVRNLLGGTRRVDVGFVSFLDSSGNNQERLFLNECQPGIAAAVVRRVTPGMKRLGGFLAFGIGSTLTALTYSAHWMRITIDEKETIEGKFLGVVAANGRYAGGGMDFAPLSSMDDGILDVILIREQARVARLRNFPKIYSGRHIDLPWILSRKGRNIRITAEDRVALEADGELLGFLPCEISILPRALPVAGL